MISYFDTSAVIPLLIAEPGSALAGQLWDKADRVASARLIYPEARAALAQARRLERLTARQLGASVRELDELYEQMDIVELDADLAHQSGELAEAHNLRGYDAVHLAAAHRIADDELIVVAGDQSLLAAAAITGLLTASVD